MWIIHKGNRKNIVNLELWQEVVIEGSNIIFTNDEQIKVMNFENEIEAVQAYGYLLEAIKRREQLVHL